MKTCRHCGTRRANRPRRLCWGCYYSPAVRELYPPHPNSVTRAVGGGGMSDRPLPVPTPHRPGTPEKLAVLMKRLTDRQHLWHPDDGFTRGEES